MITYRLNPEESKVYWVEKTNSGYYTAQHGICLVVYADKFYEDIAIVTLGPLDSLVVRHIPVKELFDTIEDAYIEAGKKNDKEIRFR